MEPEAPAVDLTPETPATNGGVDVLLALCRHGELAGVPNSRRSRKLASRGVAVQSRIHPSTSDGQGRLGRLLGAGAGRYGQPGPVHRRLDCRPKAAGGDVMVSFGGAAGISLAEYAASHGKTAQQLADAHAGVVDAYGLEPDRFRHRGRAIAKSGCDEPGIRRR